MEKPQEVGPPFDDSNQNKHTEYCFVYNHDVLKKAVTDR
jgi:hypothetical protein